LTYGKYTSIPKHLHGNFQTTPAVNKNTFSHQFTTAPSINNDTFQQLFEPTLNNDQPIATSANNDSDQHRLELAAIQVRDEHPRQAMASTYRVRTKNGCFSIGITDGTETDNRKGAKKGDRLWLRMSRKFRKHSDQVPNIKSFIHLQVFLDPGNSPGQGSCRTSRKHLILDQEVESWVGADWETPA